MKPRALPKSIVAGFGRLGDGEYIAVLLKANLLVKLLMLILIGFQ